MLPNELPDVRDAPIDLQAGQRPDGPSSPSAPVGERMKKGKRISGEAIRETVGIIGVVASLIFVGTEIRQNTTVARGQTRQDLAELNQEWLILMSTDSVFLSTFYKAWVEQNTDMNEIEVMRAHFAMRLHLRRLENVYFQFAEGLVDASALHSYGFQAGPLFSSEAFLNFWDAEQDGYDPRFVRYLDQRLRAAAE